MDSINIHEGKTHLSRLVEKAARGEFFVFAKADKALIGVAALEAPASAQVRRLGFMKGRITVPDDFDRMGSGEIERLFG